tara:strand:+ start:16770 stop:18299 length:1530 start_codon:yes stop_codon:yes gene_type:complete
MAYSFKINIQKKLNYSGSPSPGNVSSVELLTRFKTFTDSSDTPANQLAFAEAEKTIRIFKASDYFQNSLDNEANLGIAFADGTMELGDIGIATSTQTLAVTEAAPWGPPSVPTTNITRNHFKMARHSDFPVGGANLNEDPEEYKITVTGNFNGTGTSSMPSHTNNLDGLVCVVYFGSEGHENIITAIYVPTAVGPGAPTNQSVDCATSSASWSLPIGIDQPFAESIYDGVSTVYANTNHFNICSMFSEMAVNNGLNSAAQFTMCPVLNTTTYTDLANSGSTIELESDFSVNPPPGSPADVVDGVDEPVFFGDTCTASPLADGNWSSTFIGEVCPTITAQDADLHNLINACILVTYNSLTATNTLSIPGFPDFALDPIPGTVMDAQPYNLSIPFDFELEFVTWYSASVNFDVDCVLDTTLIGSITAAGSQYGDLLCEVYCCLKKLQDRYEENKLKNPKAAALDLNKLNEAMILVGLFEWAIKCNAKEAKINKYYQNILSVTGCSGCTGCD